MNVLNKIEFVAGNIFQSNMMFVDKARSLVKSGEPERHAFPANSNICE
jgi:hypothetical protein